MSSLRPSRNPGSGVMNPALPTIGSSITPDIASGFSENNFFTASRSLYGAVKVLEVVLHIRKK